jgi:putative mRNA 3-end processing factor
LAVRLAGADSPAIAADLVVARPEGLWCEAGGFHIDPWRPVSRALITHAHADHARVGHEHYLAARDSEGVLRSRLGSIALESLAWGESRKIGDVLVSFHPASHALGAAQIRLEHRGEVWVVSGDYRVESDRSCAPFEPVRCHVFVTESTFGLPIYRWAPQAQVFADVLGWWRANADEGRVSILYCYAFGKAQRILAGLADALGEVGGAPGPIVCHGAVETLNIVYRECGISLPDTQVVTDFSRGKADAALLGRALVIAPPSASGSPWRRRFGEASEAFASGWMQVRGARRRRAVDRGFVLSDHADWPGLQQAIAETGATRVIVTHGYEAVMVRWLRERGLQAQSFETEYGGEQGAEETGSGEPDSEVPAASGSPGTSPGDLPAPPR